MNTPALQAPAVTTGTPEVSDTRPQPTWADGPRLSEIERRQYEFEGGGAVSERQAGKRPGWFARLFRS